MAPAGAALSQKCKSLFAALLFVTRRTAGLGTDARPCVWAVCIFRPWSSSASRSTVSHAALCYRSLQRTSRLCALQFREKLIRMKKCKLHVVKSHS